MNPGGRKPPVHAAGLHRLEEALGHHFENHDLLIQALTHASAAPDRAASNERFEFLGDRVLGLAIAGLLLETFPDEDEGALGYRFSALARAESLARVANHIGLQPHVLLAESAEVSGCREPPGPPPRRRAAC